MHKQLDTLLQQEMTRREFMTTIGFGAVSLLGFGSLLRLLKGDSSVLPRSSSVRRGYGYGAGGYGR
jgi:hypothetical protein